MAKLVSIHEISFSADENVPPQHVFEATAEEKEFLVQRGAVRAFNSENDSGLKVFQRVGAKASTSTAQTGVELPDVSKANKAKLLEIAAAEKVDSLTGDETVEQLRTAILANRQPKDESLV